MFAEKKSVKAKQQLIQWIRSGKFAEGDKIPSGRMLASEMKISYVVSNRILRELEEEGYVHRIPGAGTFVSSCQPVRKRTSDLQVGYLVDVNISLFGRFFSAVLNHLPADRLFSNIPLRMLPGWDTVTQTEHEQWLSEVFQNRWDAVVVYGDRHFPFRELKKYESNADQINFVFFDDTEIPFLRANRIIAAMEKIGNLIGSHFLAKGRTKLAVFSLRNLDEVYRRRIGGTLQHHGIRLLNGLERAYTEKGKDFYSNVRTVPFDQNINADTAGELMDAGYRSFFVMMDPWALPVYEAAAKRHLRIGQDIEIIGMNNIAGDLLRPALTSVSLNEVRIGEVLAEAIQGKWVGKTIRVEPELFYRESSPANCSGKTAGRTGIQRIRSRSEIFS